MSFARPKASTVARGYGADHRALVAAARRQLLAAGSLPCATPGCELGGWLYATDLQRDGRRDPRAPHLDHCPPCKGHGCNACGGTGYRGLGHRRCNVGDGSRRARARQTASRLRW